MKDELERERDRMTLDVGKKVMDGYMKVAKEIEEVLG